MNWNLHGPVRGMILTLANQPHINFSSPKMRRFEFACISILVWDAQKVDIVLLHSYENMIYAYGFILAGPIIKGRVPDLYFFSNMKLSAIFQ